MSAPALSGRIWGVLVRNEWFKARKRLAFWLTLGFFAFITFVNHAAPFFEARNDPDERYALPDVWSRVFSEDGVITLIFGAIALIMLVSSEFQWRTARQNVIDGLSKTQWFWGKVMLLPLLGVIFLAVQVAMGGVFGYLGTGPGTAEGPLFPASVTAASAGALLAFLSVSGLALLLATTIRSAGPAMAVWFFWIGFGENLVPAILGRWFPGLREVLGYLPFSAAGRVLRFEQYDGAAFERLRTAAEAAERNVPQLPDLGTALAVNAGWAALFVAIAFVWFRRRDL